MTDISKRLLQAITESGKSYKELEEMTGIPSSTIQRYATGATGKIEIDRIELLAKATGTKAVSILGWESEDKTADNMIAIESDRRLQRLLSYYNLLNENGKKDADSYMDYLVQKQNKKDD